MCVDPEAYPLDLRFRAKSKIRTAVSRLAFVYIPLLVLNHSNGWFDLQRWPHPTSGGDRVFFNMFNRALKASKQWRLLVIAEARLPHPNEGSASIMLLRKRGRSSNYPIETPAFIATFVWRACRMARSKMKMLFVHV